MKKSQQAYLKENEKRRKMKGILVQTTMEEEDLQTILRTYTLGKDSKPLGMQLPQFKNVPLCYCSYVCEGYSGIYTHPERKGVTFETDEKEVYALPCDNLELMRSGRFLPGHERFIFNSIEEMLKAFPTSEDFIRKFREYFINLKPSEIYPIKSKKCARELFELDYCLDKNWSLGYNEVTFRKPLAIKNPKAFSGIKKLNKTGEEK